jgi:hypothetical protein
LLWRLRVLAKGESKGGDKIKISRKNAATGLVSEIDAKSTRSAGERPEGQVEREEVGDLRWVAQARLDNHRWLGELCSLGKQRESPDL